MSDLSMVLGRTWVCTTLCTTRSFLICTEVLARTQRLVIRHAIFHATFHKHFLYLSTSPPYAPYLSLQSTPSSCEAHFSMASWPHCTCDDTFTCVCCCRFEYNGLFGGKINKPISYLEHVNMRPYMSDTNVSLFHIM